MKKTVKKTVTKMTAVAMVAMLLGGGFAFATINDDPDPNVYWDGLEWLSLDGMEEGTHYKCLKTEDEENCVGYLENPESQGTPLYIQEGIFVEI